MAAIAAEPTAGFMTAPAAAAEIGYPLDKLRQQLRARPDLAAMFSVKIGPTRAIPADRLQDLRAALNLPPE